MKYKIPFIKPELPPVKDIIASYQEIVEANWFSNFGPFEKRFCKGVEEYIGQNTYTTTVSNATLGLMIAIKSIVAPAPEKKQILVPAFTFAAGPEAIIWCSLEPVFIDIDINTWQPDINQAEKYLKEHHGKVAGILFCNIFGVGAPEIDRWEALAKEFEKPLIIDSAAGFGSEYVDGNKLGARGDCEIFSFHVTKPFGVGEGGLVSSKSEGLIKKIRVMSNFGFNEDKKASELGLNGKMQEINAAIGLWQLDHIDSKIIKRHIILNIYKKELSKLGFTFQENDDKSPVGFASTLAPNPLIADKLEKVLNDMEIEFNKYYNPPLHKHPIFNKCEIAYNLDNTEDICSRIVSLPSHDMIDENIVKDIVKSITQ